MAILFTGGTGLLGTAMQKVLPAALYPTRQEFNVTDIERMDEYLAFMEDELDRIGETIDVIIHAAAFTSPPKVEGKPSQAVLVNIVGTANLMTLCEHRGIKLIYISTDYVFKGKTGFYEEDDDLNPINKYAWTKLGGECAVRCYDNSLIVRTSFGENEFPYPKAFVDQMTGRITVDEFAEELKRIVKMDVTGVLHVGHSEPRSVYEYAKAISPDKEIGELSRHSLSTPIPENTYLNVEKFESLKRGKE